MSMGVSSVSSTVLPSSSVLVLNQPAQVLMPPSYQLVQNVASSSVSLKLSGQLLPQTAQPLVANDASQSDQVMSIPIVSQVQMSSLPIITAAQPLLGGQFMSLQPVSSSLHLQPVNTIEDTPTINQNLTQSTGSSIVSSIPLTFQGGQVLSIPSVSSVFQLQPVKVTVQTSPTSKNPTQSIVLSSLPPTLQGGKPTLFQSGPQLQPASNTDHTPPGQNLKQLSVSKGQVLYSPTVSSDLQLHPVNNRDYTSPNCQSLSQSVVLSNQHSSSIIFTASSCLSGQTVAMTTTSAQAICTSSVTSSSSTTNLGKMGELLKATETATSTPSPFIRNKDGVLVVLRQPQTTVRPSSYSLNSKESDNVLSMNSKTEKPVVLSPLRAPFNTNIKRPKILLPRANKIICLQDKPPAFKAQGTAAIVSAYAKAPKKGKPIILNRQISKSSKIQVRNTVISKVSSTVPMSQKPRFSPANVTPQMATILSNNQTTPSRSIPVPQDTALLKTYLQTSQAATNKFVPSSTSTTSISSQLIPSSTLEGLVNKPSPSLVKSLLSTPVLPSMPTIMPSASSSTPMAPSATSKQPSVMVQLPPLAQWSTAPAR
jgi:hypothetical protein